MPVIKVWNLPHPRNEIALKKLEDTIIAGAARVEKLGLRQKDITVLFPSEIPRRPNPDNTIIVEISFLFERPGRTKELRQHLAWRVGEAVKSLYTLNRVECGISRTDPTEDGYWDSNC